MKKIKYIMVSVLLAVSFAGCSMFEVDNYDEPGETLKGAILVAGTNEPLPTLQGNTGGSVRVRLQEVSWTEAESPTLRDYTCFQDGTFQNTKLFNATYNIRVDGPFVPLVRIAANGSVLADGTQTVKVKGVTEVKFEVQPFLKVEIQGSPVVNNDSTLTVTVLVTRATSPEKIRSLIEPMGEWKDEWLNVTDIALWVSQVAFPGASEDSRFSNTLNGNLTDMLGTPFKITTKGKLPPGRPVFIRVGARINYSTEGAFRWNVSKDVIRVDIP